MLQAEISNEAYSLLAEDYIIWSDFEGFVHLSLDQPFYFRDIYLFVCSKGKVRFNINMREYEITENSIGIIMPGTIVSILDKTPDFQLHSLLVNLNFVADIPLTKDFMGSRKDATSPPQSYYIRSDNKEAEHILKYFDLLHALRPKKSELHSDKIAKGILFSLFYVYISIQQHHEEIIPDERTSRQDELTNRFFNLLRSNGMRERNVGFYADKMCLTPKYLSSLIKQTTKRSAFSWINMSTIIMAKILLKTKDHSVSQIAEELNFPNPSFFSRFFKKHTGMSPNEYRKS